MSGTFTPLKPVSPGRRAALGAACFILFLGIWSAATFTGLVRPLFLASPWATLVAGWQLFTEFGFAYDVAVTVGRVFGGFLIASAVAVPLGIAMGAFKTVEAFFEPAVSFARYLPASAFIPLLILWLGVGEAQKLAIIFIGAVFQITLMVAVSVGGVRSELVEAAYTLGARGRGVVYRVMLPAAAPQISESLRLVLGWAWTYVIVAELIGASAGIGFMIIDAQRFLDTGQMIFGIFVIGVIGLISDFLFKRMNERLFAWAAP
ncbi:MAG TPA: ABC transporter permease [Arenibaculum sp.]|nr:ABC transporter permease [Arenibaculum sp.]